MSFSSRFSLPTVRAIAELLDEAGLSEITIETTDETNAQRPERLVVRREVVSSSSHTVGESAASASGALTTGGETPQSAPPAESNLVLVPSPTVGFFHHIEKPVGEGATVKSGQVIGLVTTLAIPNDVTAPVEGRIAEILVAEGQGVAFGQPLFVIEKTLPKES